MEMLVVTTLKKRTVHEKRLSDDVCYRRYGKEMQYMEREREEGKGFS